MKKNLMLWIFLSAFCLAPTLVGAEVIRGEIKDLHPDLNTMTIAKSGQPGGPTQDMKIQVTPGANFNGLSSLNELAVGDEVVVDVMKTNISDLWQANSVTIDKVKIANPAKVAGNRLKK